MSAANTGPNGKELITGNSQLSIRSGFARTTDRIRVVVPRCITDPLNIMRPVASVGPIATPVLTVSMISTASEPARLAIMTKDRQAEMGSPCEGQTVFVENMLEPEETSRGHRGWPLLIR